MPAAEQAREDVHEHGQVDELAAQTHVGDVGHPNLIRTLDFQAGDQVTTEGQGGVGFFVIEGGEAKVTVGGENRRKLGPGDYFGEVALLTDSPRTATITAETDLHCYGMTSWDFKPLVESHSSIAWHLLQAMAKNYQSPQH